MNPASISDQVSKEEETVVPANSARRPPRFQTIDATPARRSSDTHSIQSGESGTSINDPKLLASVEDAIKRLILPELPALKEEQRAQKNRRKLKRYLSDTHELRLGLNEKASSSELDSYRSASFSSLSGSEISSSTASSDLGKGVQAILDDWSGRGPHVDFLPNEDIPLTRGRFLGHGSMGGVYETIIRGHAFAWKTRFCRRRIGPAERKEIEILKKVSHDHIVRLAGSYTHRQFLGLLLYPVAVCDLATFLEDVEAYFGNAGLDSTQQDRLAALNLLASPLSQQSQVLTKFLSAKMGCIICAVEYLHGQKVRHKDLKPSNILLSKNGLWLTDFGSATDFSHLTVSSTENGERGTEKYFAPEVAAFQPSGRSADVFSLGCVLLEMNVMISAKSLSKLKDIRTAPPKSFQANLDSIQEWLQDTSASLSPHAFLLTTELRNMLAREATERPTIDKIRSKLVLIDTFQMHVGENALFGDCCRRPFISSYEHELSLDQLKSKYTNDMNILKARHDSEHREWEATTTSHARKINHLRNAFAQSEATIQHLWHIKRDRAIVEERSATGTLMEDKIKTSLEMRQMKAALREVQDEAESLQERLSEAEKMGYTLTSDKTQLQNQIAASTEGACIICRRSFSSIDKLVAHILKIHRPCATCFSEERTHPWNMCGFFTGFYNFASAAQVKERLKQVWQEPSHLSNGSRTALKPATPTSPRLQEISYFDTVPMRRASSEDDVPDSRTPSSRTSVPRQIRQYPQISERRARSERIDAQGNERSQKPGMMDKLQEKTELALNGFQTLKTIFSTSGDAGNGAHARLRRSESNSPYRVEEAYRRKKSHRAPSRFHVPTEPPSRENFAELSPSFNRSERRSRSTSVHDTSLVEYGPDLPHTESNKRRY